MANYYCTTRTNYFKVKDEAAFKIWAADKHFKTVQSQDGRFALLQDSDSDGGFQFYDEDSGDYLELMDVLPLQVADGEVVVVVEAGAEKCRYVTGLAYAFDNQGNQVNIDINEIYKKAKKRWPEATITRAEY